MKVRDVDPTWYRSIWTLDIQDLSWVESTGREIDFVLDALDLRGPERALDLACGFGRHSLELARRGYSVVGVDITAAYIDEARRRATEEGLDATFICADLRDVSFCGEFDLVLSLADGAIGYLENEEENLRIFDVIATAMKPEGKHLMAVCNAAHAREHFPRRHWERGGKSLSLADFAWREEDLRMVYAAYSFQYGRPLSKPDGQGSVSSIRLYTVEELRQILADRGMRVVETWGRYDASIPASADELALLVYSRKNRSNADSVEDVMQQKDSVHGPDVG